MADSPGQESCRVTIFITARWLTHLGKKAAGSHYLPWQDGSLIWARRMLGHNFYHGKMAHSFGQEGCWVTIFIMARYMTHRGKKAAGSKYS